MKTEGYSLPCLDRLHASLKSKYGSAPVLESGLPHFLFRGERGEWTHTLSSLDRHWHGGVSPEAWGELDNITAFIMQVPLPKQRLDPKLAGAFAQHYGLPTQVFDFTADISIATFFAGDSSGPPFASPRGCIAVLDVAEALRGPCALFDLRNRPESRRAQKQKAFGLIHSGFMVDDFEDLKRPEISNKLGLKWLRFGHCPGEHLFLESLGLPIDLLDHTNDEFAIIPQLTVDAYTTLNGPILVETATILARNIPNVGRTREENIQRWSNGPATET
jgi:FRG domain